MANHHLKKRRKKIGQPAGVLLPLDSDNQQPIKISLIDYDGDNFLKKSDISIEECALYLEQPRTTWIIVEGIHDPELIAAIGQYFHLHALMLEDIATLGQRSKLDHYPGTIYLVIHALAYQHENEKLTDEQVSFVLGDNFLITFLEGKSSFFNHIFERLRNPSSRLRHQHADYLCYALIDTIVDYYFIVLEQFDEKLLAVEGDMIHHPSPKVQQQLQVLKRELIVLRRAIWPLREVISQFSRLDTPLVSDNTQLFMQDVYDHTIQMIDMIESFRDVASGLLDLYISTINQKMNEIVKVLTMVSTLFVPLTFICSLYGMNIVNMPELDWPYTYPIVLLVMLFIAIGMVTFFKRRQWI